MIKVEEESAEIKRVFGGLVENCHFCNKPTRFWNSHTNNPVCPPCAKVHDVSELPYYGNDLQEAKKKPKRKSA